MQIDIVGIGMGDAKTLTQEVRDCILNADMWIGGARMLQAAQAMVPEGSAQRVEAITPSKVAEALGQAVQEGRSRACVLCSGDTGFFSLADTIRSAVANTKSPAQVRVYPGITTVQYLAARLGRPWQNCKLASAHGRECNILGTILAYTDVFFLTGGTQTPATIIQDLGDCGLGEIEVTVGENLSYPNERITTGTVWELAGKDFDALSAIWVHHDALADPEVAPYVGTFCIPDDMFMRGDAPMTKAEVRGLVSAKLRVRPGETLWDVGAGTGSVSIEVAAAVPFAHVWAVEMKEQACRLIEQNRTRFGTYNVHVVEGQAPQALQDLPSPDVAFIGGSTGHVASIIDCALQANPACRLVATAVTMETVGQLTSVLGQLVPDGRLDTFQATQLGVTRTRKAGRYHLFAPESPVYLFEAWGKI